MNTTTEQPVTDKPKLVHLQKLRSKHTIYQLRKQARRIPRVMNRAFSQLRKPAGKLTADEVSFYRGAIAGAQAAAQLLAHELAVRNVGGKAFRDATPHKQRRKEVAS